MVWKDRLAWSGLLLAGRHQHAINHVHDTVARLQVGLFHQGVLHGHKVCGACQSNVRACRVFSLPALALAVTWAGTMW